MRSLLPLVLLWATAGVSYAHEDRILKLAPDGRLPDVPATFGPATVDFRVRGDAPPRLKLTIGAHSYAVPECVTRLIRTRERRDIAIRGSWYHTEERLPYYIGMTFYDPGSEHDQAEGQYVQLLFNLRNAQLLDVWVSRALFLGFGRRLDQKKPRDYCSFQRN
ncbi:MAG: hypothetical protein JF591_18645 [Lysobacter sp.]|nr:hypothetical protein [Lysobacter sp.]